MAREGMTFTNFYSGSPACTASRYALLTGRDPMRSGFSWVLSPSSPKGLHTEEITIADALKSQGYATAAYGKWHLGFPNERNDFNPDRLPLAHGFDEWVGLPYSNDMRPPKWQPIPLISGPGNGSDPRFEGYKVLAWNPDQSKLTKLYTERAKSFMKAHKDEPFFVYMPYAMPHIPLYPGAEFEGGSRRGKYGDVIEEIDWSAGQVMKTLKELDLDDRTLVVFTSDNGPWIIKGDKGGSSGLFRDGKGSTWEGGMRVPGVAWWPGKIAPMQKVMQPAGVLDLLPTAMDLAGVERPTDRTLDGMSLVPIFEGGSLPERQFVLNGPGQLHALRYGSLKLHVRTSSQTGKKYFEGRVPLLFDLNDDPSEEWDLSKRQPEDVNRLQQMIDAHKAQVKAEGTFWD